MLIFKLAWRNIWRNKRRAIITMSSIGVSLILVIFMGQMQRWMWDNTIDNSMAQYVGYMQISDTSFVDEAVLDNSFNLDQIDTSAVLKTEGVRGVFPRIQFGALASFNINAKSVGVLGYYPSNDNAELKMDMKLKEGELLNDKDKSVLITNSMAQYFKIGVGDTLVLFGSGYQGITAAGLYPIKGIVNYPAGYLSNIVFMAMDECQYFYGMEGRVTNLLVNIDQGADLFNAQDRVKEIVTDQSLIVRNWQEVQPGFKDGMDIDLASKDAMMSVLMVIVIFGIFGTIVMMYNERIMEFSILLSIGMGKTKILFTTLFEVYLLSILGIIGSWIAVTPILFYFQNNPIHLDSEGASEALAGYGFEPIISVGMYPEVYLSSSWSIFKFTMLISIYIVVKILRLQPLSGTQKQ